MVQQEQEQWNWGGEWNGKVTTLLLTFQTRSPTPPPDIFVFIVSVSVTVIWIFLKTLPEVQRTQLKWFKLEFRQKNDSRLNVYPGSVVPLAMFEIWSPCDATSIVLTSPLDVWWIDWMVGCNTTWILLLNCV